MNQQPTSQGRGSSLPVPGERPQFEATAGSRPVDFLEAGQASGWRWLLPWAFGLLTLFALVLVVLHFGTIEEFSRLLGRPALNGCFSRASPKQRPMRLQLWCGDRLCGEPGTHDRSARSSPLVSPSYSPIRWSQVEASAAVGLVAYFAAYLASVLTSLGILWLNDRASAPVFVVVAIFVAIVVAIPSGVLWMKQWANRLPVSWLRRCRGPFRPLRRAA